MNTAAPQVIVIAGPNGAGKSTLAPHLLKDTFGLREFVNADTIAAGLSAFSPESVAFEAGRIMLKRLYDLAAADQSFAFESTLATRSYAKWLRRLKDQQGYSFHLLYLWLHSPELAVERVRGRVSLGGHNVDSVVVRRRYQKSLHNLFELYLPLTDSWAVYDNSVAGSPRLVALGGGAYDVTVHDHNLWESMKGAAE